MSSIVRRLAGRLPGIALLPLLAVSCTSTPRSREHALQAPALSTGFVLGTVPPDADVDCDELAQVPGNAARLRRAWIQLQLGRPEQAIDRTAEVLYAPERPSPGEEALARYIRAECHRRMGHPERGSYDLERATALALDPDLVARLQRDSAEPAKAGAPVAEASPALRILPRANWQPMATIGSRLDPMEKIYRITVHHSAMLFRDTSAPACANQIRLIQHAHMVSPDRRYGDIGYHFLIDPAGRVWEGRMLRYQGAHARADNNRGNIGICMLGNFVRGGDGQRPTPAQATALQSLLGSLVGKYHVDLAQLHGHRDFVDTECPGPYGEALLAEIVRNLRRQGAAADHLAARE